MKILIVDDDALVARSIERGLRGHRVTVEQDGRSAIGAVESALLAGQPFDLVICDLKMPNMDGRQVLAELRKQRDRPILVLLSGLSAEETLSDCGVVADGVMAKPCRTADILGLVECVRERRTASTQILRCDRAIA